MFRSTRAVAATNFSLFMWFTQSRGSIPTTLLAPFCKKHTIFQHQHGRNGHCQNQLGRRSLGKCCSSAFSFFFFDFCLSFLYFPFFHLRFSFPLPFSETFQTYPTDRFVLLGGWLAGNTKPPTSFLWLICVWVSEWVSSCDSRSVRKAVAKQQQRRYSLCVCVHVRP